MEALGIFAFRRQYNFEKPSQSLHTTLREDPEGFSLAFLSSDSIAPLKTQPYHNVLYPDDRREQEPGPGLMSGGPVFQMLCTCHPDNFPMNYVYVNVKSTLDVPGRLWSI